MIRLVNQVSFVVISTVIGSTINNMRYSVLIQQLSIPCHIIWPQIQKSVNNFGAHSIKQSIFVLLPGSAIIPKLLVRQDLLVRIDIALPNIAHILKDILLLQTFQILQIIDLIGYILVWTAVFISKWIRQILFTVLIFLVIIHQLVTTLILNILISRWSLNLL